MLLSFASVCLVALPVPQSTSTQSAQADEADRSFGGPEGVEEQIEIFEEPESIYVFENFQRWAKPYFDWKKRLQEEHDFSFGFTAHLLYQHASDTLNSEPNAAGGIYRLFGKWALVNRDRENTGRIEWRVEARNELGGWPAPGSLATGASALNTGFGYSNNFDLDVPVLQWTQLFNEGTAGVAVGRLAFDVYLDAFLFQTFSRGFLNRAFLLNPTIATTGIGALGAVAKGFVGDQFWVGGQIYDGNAASGEFDFDTVEEGEWLKSIEVGWTPSIDRSKTDRIQFTYWDKDARSRAGVADGAGWAVSASWQATERLIPFTRFGHSDGGAGVAAESAASVGAEFSPRPDQALSLGFGWADPSSATFGPGLGDEYVIETSYKMQLSPNFSLTPDVQLLFDPASNPNEDTVWVLGLRAIFSL